MMIWKSGLPDFPSSPCRRLRFKAMPTVRRVPTPARMPRNSRASIRTGRSRAGSGTICLRKRRRPLPRLLSKSTVTDRRWLALGSADFRYEVTEDNERAEQPEDTTANALFLAAMRLEKYKRKPPRITKKETPMRYRLLGNSGLRVSEAALGTMTCGDAWGWGANDGLAEEVSRIISAVKRIYAT